MIDSNGLAIPEGEELKSKYSALVNDLLRLIPSYYYHAASANGNESITEQLRLMAEDAERYRLARDAWVEIGARVPVEPGFYLAMMVEENSFGYSSKDPVLVEFDVYTTHPKQFVISDSWTNGPEDCATEMTHWMPMPAPPEKQPGDPK